MMFGSDTNFGVVVGIVAVYVLVIVTMGTKPKRSKIVAGSRNQYSTAPSQTILSPQFFMPKIRRLVVLLAILLILQTRYLHSDEDRIVILAVHTGLMRQIRGSIKPMYKWLMRKHTKIRNRILLAVWMTTHWRAQLRRAGRRWWKRATPAQRHNAMAHELLLIRILVRCTRRPHPYLRHCFDQTKGYEGEGPEWQGDDMSIPNSQPDYFTSFVFLNADGACVNDDQDTTGASRNLDTMASIHEMLAWNVTCIGLGDAQRASESNALQLQLNSGEEPIWPESRWVRSQLRNRPSGIPGGTCLGVASSLSRRIIATYELHSTFGWFTGLLLHGRDVDGTPTKLAIITVYCPLRKNAGGAWNLMHDRLKVSKNTRDPAQQFYHELTD
jgi:hypothetical protein